MLKKIFVAQTHFKAKLSQQQKKINIYIYLYYIHNQKYKKTTETKQETLKNDICVSCFFLLVFLYFDMMDLIYIALWRSHKPSIIFCCFIFLFLHLL